MKPKNKQYIEHTRLNETLFSKTGIKLKFYSIDNGGDYPIHGAALFFVGSGNEKWVVTQWNDVGKNVENSFLDIDVKSLEERRNKMRVMFTLRVSVDKVQEVDKFKECSFG